VQRIAGRKTSGRAEVAASAATGVIDEIAEANECFGDGFIGAAACAEAIGGAGIAAVRCVRVKRDVDLRLPELPLCVAGLDPGTSDFGKDGGLAGIENIALVRISRPVTARMTPRADPGPVYFPTLLTVTSQLSG